MCLAQKERSSVGDSPNKVLAKCSIWRIKSVNIRLASRLAAGPDSLIVVGLCNCKAVIQYNSFSLVEEDDILHMQLGW